MEENGSKPKKMIAGEWMDGHEELATISIWSRNGVKMKELL